MMNKYAPDVRFPSNFLISRSVLPNTPLPPYPITSPRNARNALWRSDTQRCCNTTPLTQRLCAALLYKSEALLVTWEWPSGQFWVCCWYQCEANFRYPLDWKLESGEKVQDWEGGQIQKFLLATCQTGNVAKTIKATKEDLKRDNAAKKLECEERPLRMCIQQAKRSSHISVGTIQHALMVKYTIGIFCRIYTKTVDQVWAWIRRNHR